ncbi:MAG TPA: hypothetical protein VHR66_16380 [Gemmataceae bacterium]|jgi:hypothetical protein|nr:hypothetical protein [Gemmataceae bacterium]
MGEFSSVDADRLERVRRMAAALYDGLVAKVIAEIKELPGNCRQSGDSRLKDVWEEFKYQKQRDQSIFFELFEEAIRDICARHGEVLDREQQGLLWLWSEGYVDWDEEDGEIPWGYPVQESIVKEIYRRVCNIANNEELLVDPDEERDREAYEDDLRPFREG